MNKIYLIGNAHLDPVWLWKWQEGFAEIKATFQSALDRIRQFDEFVFTCAGASYYQWVEKNCPAMFEEIREAVRNGRWIIVGGMWIQPDCNLPCGETFARHTLYSQQYYLEKFNRTCVSGYNVDSFGHAYSLPQILVKSGMTSYCFLRPGPHENSAVETSLFSWQSADGSVVTAFRINDSYNDWINGNFHANREKMDRSIEISEKENTDIMNFYGVGNHGGGPTIKGIEILREYQTSLGNENVIFSSPDEYFKNIKSRYELKTIDDELQYHAVGCYLSHSKIKKLCRKSEMQAITAERFSTLSSLIAGHPVMTSEIRDCWENILFNSFHDILGGCSIEPACDDAIEFYGHSLTSSSKILNSALQKISWEIDTDKGIGALRSREGDWLTFENEQLGTPVVVFNPHSFEVSQTIRCNREVKSVADDDGRLLPFQLSHGNRSLVEFRNDVIFNVFIPPLGYKVYWISNFRDSSQLLPDDIVSYQDGILENDSLRIVFDENTMLVESIYDKKREKAIMSKNSCVPVVINEKDADAWAHDKTCFNDIVGQFTHVSHSLIDEGPLYCRLRVVYEYDKSMLVQDYILESHSNILKVNCILDYSLKFHRVRLDFHTPEKFDAATFDIPYGKITRTLKNMEVPGNKWVTFGDFALLNDGKYSYVFNDDMLGMSVARSPVYTQFVNEININNNHLDMGRQAFSYGIMPAEELSEVIKASYLLNRECEFVIETYHKGNLPREYSAVNVSASNIILEVFKFAENKNGLILRLYECEGKDTSCEITVAPLKKNFTLLFKANEIKTVHIADEITEEMLLTEMESSDF